MRNKTNGLIHHSPDQIHVTNVRLERPRMQPRDHRLDEERPEPLLVQHVRHHRAEHLRTDPSVLPQLVQVLPESQLLDDGLSVGREARQADVQVRTHLEDLGELERDGLAANAETFVGSDSDALVALHRDKGPAVVRKDRLEKDLVVAIKLSIKRMALIGVPDHHDTDITSNNTNPSQQWLCYELSTLTDKHYVLKLNKNHFRLILTSRNR